MGPGGLFPYLKTHELFKGFGVEEIALNLIALPPQPLKPFRGDRCGLDIRVGISSNENKTGQILTHHLKHFIMVLRLDSFRA